MILRSRPLLVVALDGLIADTPPLRARAVAAGLQAAGIDMEPPDQYDVIAGRTIAEAVRFAVQAQLGEEDETLVDIVSMQAERSCAAFMRDTTRLKKGTADWVKRAASRWRLIVRSDSNRSDAEQILDVAGIEMYISLLRAADDGVQQPSAPPSIVQSYAAIIERTKAHAGEGAHIIGLECAPETLCAQAQGVELHHVRELREFTL